MKLRPYQTASLDAVLRKFKAGVYRQLIALPTGCGKTVVFANLMTHLGIKGRVLVLLHREELADQAADKIKKWNPHLRVGVEMAERTSSQGDDVVVASVATIGRENSARIAKFNPDEFEVCICDEAHHSVADSYIRVFRHFGLLEKDSKKLLLGVTATPRRGDGVALAQVYDQIVYQMSVRDAVQKGWLSDVVAMRLQTKVNLDSVATRLGDFQLDQLQHEVNTAERNKMIVASWLQNAQGRKTVIFCVDIQHSKDLAAAFKAAGVSCEAVWGDDPDRAEKLAKHRTSKIQVLVNCNILVEGYDDWSIDCIVMARPTKSPLLFTQMVGRGLRLQDGIDNLVDAKAKGMRVTKENCLVLDVCDTTQRHSLVNLCSLFGLPPKLDLKNGSVIKAAKTLEEYAKNHPDVALHSLSDLSELPRLSTEAVNLFEVRFEPEILEASKLQWHKLLDGTYRLLLPNKEEARVGEDLAGRWWADATIATNPVRKINFVSLEEAIAYIEERITRYLPSVLTLLRRKEKWHGDPASAPQIGFLTKLGVKVPAGITKGEASLLLNKTLTAKDRWLKPKQKPTAVGAQ